jgi:hypothetical protein
MGKELTRQENEWQDQATAAAVAAARRVVCADDPIRMATPIGRLSDVQWGWIVAAVIFAWIAKRAEQATAEGLDTERTVRMTGYEPDPWDAGAVATILPDLADTPGVDWAMPLNDWPRETMVAFLTTALALVRKATIARDFSGGTITRKAADRNDAVGL